MTQKDKEKRVQVCIFAGLSSPSQFSVHLFQIKVHSSQFVFKNRISKVTHYPNKKRRENRNNLFSCKLFQQRNCFLNICFTATRS